VHFKSQIMKYFILFGLISLFASFKIPGSGTAFLDCKSESGRTILHAELQDIDGLLEKAELIVDSKKLGFTEDDEAYTIFDPQKKVFTIYITGKMNKDFPNGRFIQLWALPETFKIINGDRENQVYEFKARMEATEPRQNKDLRIPQVELYCKLKYSI
jgi:hypothetical protein